MTWNELVYAVTARYPNVRTGKMFGMPCLKGPEGKVVAALSRDGGIVVRLLDETARGQALALPGAELGSHAYDPRRQMRAWVHIPATQAGEWLRLVERALEKPSLSA